MKPRKQKPMIEGLAPPAGVLIQSRREFVATPAFRPEFVRSVRMRPVLTPIVSGIVFILLVAFAFALKPVYRAESLLYLEPTSGKLLSDSTNGLSDSSKYDTFLQQQIETATRLDILVAALQTLPAGTYRGLDESVQLAALRLQRALKIQRVSTTYQVSISLKGPDAASTAIIVNAVTSAYLQATRKDERARTDGRAQILGAERQRLGAGFETAGADQARTGNVEARLNSQLARQTTLATSAGPKLQRAAEFPSEILPVSARYAAVDGALRSPHPANDGPGMVRLSLPASVPIYPEPNRRKLLLLLALPIALLCGAFAAVFARKRDRRLYHAKDVEDLLGFAPIAILPSSLDVSDSVLDGYILRMAGGIENAYRVRAARVFLFTSVSPSIRTSQLVVSVSAKLQQLGLGVLIVEPTDILATPARTIPQVQVAKATIAADDAVHKGFAKCNLERMKSQHDLVFINGHPLLSSAETEYAARCADATILIAQCAVSLRTELFQAATLLQRLNVSGVGTVLDQLRLCYAEPGFARMVRAMETQPREAAGRPVAYPAPRPTPAADVDASPSAFSPNIGSQPQMASITAAPAPATEMASAPDMVSADASLVTRKTDVVQAVVISEPLPNPVSPASDLSSTPTVSTPTASTPHSEEVKSNVVPTSEGRSRLVISARNPVRVSAAHIEDATPVKIDRHPDVTTAPQETAQETAQKTDQERRPGWLNRVFRRQSSAIISSPPDGDNAVETAATPGTAIQPHTPIPPAVAASQVAVRQQQPPKPVVAQVEAPVVTTGAQLLDHIVPPLLETVPVVFAPVFAVPANASTHVFAAVVPVPNLNAKSSRIEAHLPSAPRPMSFAELAGIHPETAAVASHSIEPVKPTVPEAAVRTPSVIEAPAPVPSPAKQVSLQQQPERSTAVAETLVLATAAKSAAAQDTLPPLTSATQTSIPPVLAPSCEIVAPPSSAAADTHSVGEPVTPVSDIPSRWDPILPLRSAAPWHTRPSSGNVPIARVEEALSPPNKSEPQAAPPKQGRWTQQQAPVSSEVQAENGLPLLTRRWALLSSFGASSTDASAEK